MIHLVDISPGNWRTKLQVSESQRYYVANSTVMLARAYAYREQRSSAFLIYEDETPVGMGLYRDCPEMEAYDFDQIFIDERYQGRGLGGKLETVFPSAQGGRARTHPPRVGRAY